MEIKNLAAQFNCSEDALQQLTDFVLNRAQQHPELFQAMPELFLRRAVEAWRDMSRTFYQDALDNPEKIGMQVLQALKQRQAQ